MVKILIAILLSFNVQFLHAKTERKIVKKIERSADKIELEAISNPDFPTKFHEGCHCDFGDLAVQKGPLGGDEIVIQRNGKYEEVASLKDLESKLINAQKSVLSFSARNENLNLKFSCEQFKINEEDCDEGGCGQKYHICDIEASSKDGKTKKIYKKQKGKCVC